MLVKTTADTLDNILKYTENIAEREAHRKIGYNNPVWVTIFNNWTSTILICLEDIPDDKNSVKIAPWTGISDKYFLNQVYLKSDVEDNDSVALILNKNT